MDKLTVAWLVIVVPVVLVISYSLAKTGEPGSQWLWCHVMGIC